MRNKKPLIYQSGKDKKIEGEPAYVIAVLVIKYSFAALCIYFLSRQSPEIIGGLKTILSKVF